MDIQVGMYVRTKKGIGKVVELKKHDLWGFIIKIIGQYNCYSHSSTESLSDVIKASHNIIDLIEVGDYVNGDRIEEIENGELRFNWSFEYSEYISYYEKEDIKSIVTKEQFESIGYKVGD